LLFLKHTLSSPSKRSNSDATGIELIKWVRLNFVFPPPLSLSQHYFIISNAIPLYNVATLLALEQPEHCASPLYFILLLHV
jgi:hypothetical protein